MITDIIRESTRDFVLFTKATRRNGPYVTAHRVSSFERKEVGRKSLGLERESRCAEDRAGEACGYGRSNSRQVGVTIFCENFW